MHVFLSSAPSSAPGSLQGYNTSSTSIKVTWQSPAAVNQNGILTGFTVYYQAVGGAFTNGTVQQKVVGNVSEVELTGLEIYVEYNINVTASTAAGEGPPSVSILVRTAEDGKAFSNCTGNHFVMAVM